MKAIVTGANGFIGKRLCLSLLKNDFNVICVVRKYDTCCDLLDYKGVRIIECSLGNYQELTQKIKDRDIDIFYHLAWECSYGDILSNDKIQNKNIDYSCQAIRIAKELSVKKFIFAGTINELELVELFRSETNFPRPKSIYGITKLACDFELKTLSISLGINYNTAIIGSCFGPRDMSMRIHNAFILSLLKNEKPQLVACENYHDWVYVDEVAEMFVEIGKKSINLKNYYLGHNSLRKLKDILIDVKNIINPSFNIEFGTIPGDLFVDYKLVDINSVYEDTNYSNNNFNFKDNIILTSEWLKQKYL